MTELLDIAIQAAKIGAQKAQSYFNTDLKIEIKKDDSPVTIADRETEKAIKEYILSQDSQAKFVGEEFGGDYSQDEYWLVDPIDGTAYFSRGIPIWGTLVTYVRHGRADIGVSYVPFFNELLYAERGKGTFLNEKQIHVSQTLTIKDAFVSYVSFYRITGKVPGFTTLCEMARKAKGVGDSYGYHLLASGRVDVRLDGAALPFDVAGMVLAIEEAGGKVTNFKGDPWTFADEDVLATNGILHDEVVKIVNNS